MERAPPLGRDPLNEASAPAPVAEIHAAVKTSAHDKAIGELGPVAGALHTRVSRPDMQVALRIIAERVLEPEHVVRPI